MLKTYAFWLVVVSLCCLAAERIAPWRKDQRLLRPGLAQDVFWLVFNGLIAAIVFAVFFGFTEGALSAGFRNLFGIAPDHLRLITPGPLAVQVAVVLVASDFVEWFVHNALHRWRPLWAIHRVHHSIQTMDWIGNFRFHWGEILVYRTVKYIPVAVLGVRWEAILISAVLSTLIGHFNHANLNISWGPLRYVLNSPRMHIWHHDKSPARRAGVNFAVVFSLWDWIFGTAYMPREARQPDELGFRGMDQFPTSLFMRFFLPASRRRRPS